MCPAIRTHPSCPTVLLRAVLLRCGCQGFVFTVHARLLSLHVRSICRTTQQLDCDLATVLLHWISGNHPYPSQRGSNTRKSEFDRRPYLAPTCRALKHVHRSEQTTLSRRSVCTPTFAYPRQELRRSLDADGILSLSFQLWRPVSRRQRHTLHFAYVSGVGVSVRRGEAMSAPPPTPLCVPPPPLHVIGACLASDSIAHTRDAPAAPAELRWHPRFFASVEAEVVCPAHVTF